MSGLVHHTPSFHKRLRSSVSMSRKLMDGSISRQLSPFCSNFPLCCLLCSLADRFMLVWSPLWWCSSILSCITRGKSDMASVHLKYIFCTSYYTNISCRNTNTLTHTTHPFKNKHILLNKGLTTALHPAVLVQCLILWLIPLKLCFYHPFPKCAHTHNSEKWMNLTTLPQPKKIPITLHQLGFNSGR